MGVKGWFGDAGGALVGVLRKSWLLSKSRLLCVSVQG